MTRTSVGILRGGPSSEYSLSLKTGAAMLAALPEDEYDVRDIFVDKSGLWHLRGTPADPARALRQVDVVLNALHGGPGEDGTAQRIFERFRVPYSGSRPLPSALSLNKARAREIFQKAGIATPRGFAFTLDNPMNTQQMADFIFSEFGPPYIVKPVSEGAGNGILYVATIIELPDAIGDVLDAYGAALVEEYLLGEEASVAVTERFRGEDLYVFPPAHVEVPSGHLHLRYDHHDQGLIQHTVPSSFSHAEKKALADLARAAHRALGLSHFSRADIILTRNGPKILEMNTNPGLYPGASLPHMLESVGSSIKEYVRHAVNLAKWG
ncbi:ATP-grasp domain-containing protein [Candidatus Parcubacteria bacterium]|nr:MAG: ATP-grasp domain-containing protein [Candidatus Parcubacteria bacterium]